MRTVTFKCARVEKTLHVLAISLGVTLLSTVLFAQGSSGRILGTVTDQTGAVLPGATVSVIDTERGLTRTLTTDAAGEYNAPTLIPGNYTVRVDATGFKRLERQNVVLVVGQELRVDLTPQPGDQTQTVTVTEAIPLVDAASSTLGGALTNTEVNDLPLNGRNYQSLLGLRPGVVLQRGGSPWTQSTNNSRPDETAWMIDGVLNVSFWDATPVVGGGSFITDGAVILPIDAIQEFNLMENPKAEFGWKPGAIVNVGIRSGTNTLHGSAYAFGRDDSWDARNIFDPGILNGAPNPKLPTQLEQFGAVAGGRIIKDKLFFFGGYEGLRSSVGTVYAVQIPETGSQATARNPAGDPEHSMVDAVRALQAAHIPVSPVSLKLLGCTVAPIACTGGLIAGATANSTSWTSTFPNTNTSNNGLAKIDYNINSKHRLNGMIYSGRYQGSGQDFPQVNQLFTDSFPKTVWTGDVNWVWTPSSTLVNEARFGYNSGSQFAGGIDPGVADGSGGLCTSTGCGGKGYPLNTGLGAGTIGLPYINTTGFMSGSGFLGARGGRPITFGPSSFYDYNDSISYLRGSHALRFGGEFAPIHSGEIAGDSRGRIQFKGGATPGLTDCGGRSCVLEDFFAGNPTRAIQQVGNGDLAVNWRKTAVFFQDDWRIKPKLMLNLGLRWEYTSPMKADGNLLGNFDPTQGLVQQGQPGVGSTLWKPDYKNFSPRAGFAWDVTGKGTTVLRGGASVLYSTLPLASFTSQPGEQNVPGGASLAGVPTGACATVVVIGGPPCTKTVDPGAPGGGITFGNASIPGSQLNWNGPLYPGGAGISCTAAVPCSVAAIDPHFKTPYVVNWSLGVQHAFGSNLSLEVGYVGNHGDNLLGITDLNMVNPATGDAPFAAKFPYLQYINYMSNYARSNYDSLQSTLTKRLSHGLNFVVGYTYGHGLDNGSLNRFGLIPQNSLNTAAEYGNSDLDVRHRVSITASYTIPGKKGFGQLLEGWKLNTIVNLQTGQPWNTNDTAFNFSGNGDSSDRWDFFGNPSDFKSVGTRSIPYCSGPGSGGCSITDAISGQFFFTAAQSTAMWGQCTAVAPDPGTLATAGCYVSGKSVMTPPKNGTFGTMGRNIFRDTGYKNVDFSVFKDFKFKEGIGAQFRFEVFNVFNHPIFANPSGSAPGSIGQSDPSNTGIFGCGCNTPDVQAGNPIVGSGGSRDIQLGLKLTF
jgi:hypothetical protein